MEEMSQIPDEETQEGRKKSKQPTTSVSQEMEVQGRKIEQIGGSMAKRPGLYANIHAKRRRIKAGSGEKMRKPGSKGAPTAANFRRAAKTAKKR